MAFRRVRIALSFVLVWIWAAPASAATATAQFLVSATVLDVCAVAATPLAFNNYTPASDTAAQSTLTVTCTLGLGYSIALDQGTTMGAAVNGRLLDDGNGHTLAYGLYTDNTYGTIWGDGTLSTATMGPETGNGLGQTYTVYGKIASGQYVPSGGYTDTITVTVNY